MNGAGTPEWVLWLGGAIGSLVAAFVARSGWKAGGGEKPGKSSSVSLEAGIVDSSTTLRLSAAIEGLTELGQELTEHGREPRRRAMQAIEDLVAVTRDLHRELNELRLELRNIRGEMSRRQ